MKPLRVAPAFEAPRLVHVDDIASTAECLRAWLLRGASLQSYDPARRLASIAVPRLKSIEWLERQCDRLRPALNREPNKRLIRGFWDLGGERQWAFHEPVGLRYGYRSDLMFRIADDWQIVEAGRPYALWIQARSGSTKPDLRHMGIYARIFMLAAERAGYPELGLYIADMREAEGDKRKCTIWSLDDLSVASSEEAEATLQTLAFAYDQLRREGFDPAMVKKQRREKTRRDRGISPDRDLFT